MNDPSSTRPLPVRSFGGGRYVASGQLGEGGQKCVYLVRDTALARDCALSLLTPDLDHESRERLQREARTIAGLGVHPNVVTVFDMGEDEGRPYIVSEYVAGGDLAAELRRAAGALPLERALSVVRDIARAVAFVHRANVIHRDVKPGNIWITSEGVAKLGDFGLALGDRLVRITSPDTAFGTAAYMSPEQALSADLDHRSDLYSLGCILYELVTGRTPFSSDTPIALVSQHVNLAPPPPSRINPLLPERLERLILKLLAKSRADRPASAEEVLEELEEIERELVGGTGVPGPTQTLPPLYSLSRLVFAGRGPELQALRAGLDRALGGQGCLFLISGETGIGKSRLSQELGLHAQMLGAKVVTGRCSEEASSPYQPFVEILDALVGREKTRDLRRVLGDEVVLLAKFLPRFAKRLKVSETQRTFGESDRYLLFQAATQLLAYLARDSGLVLVLEDLQWADRATVNLLQHLAYRLVNTRLLVLGIYRDVEPGYPLLQATGEMRRDHLYEHIRLSSLTVDEVRTLLAGAEGSRVPDAFAIAVWQLTGGNPFFIEEVLRHLAQTGRLRWRGGHLEVEDFAPSDLQVPEAVRDVVALRLTQVSQPCQELLRLASALTGSFEWDVLKRLADVPEGQLADLVDEAVTAQFISEVPDPGGRFDFKHALVRHALQESLSLIRRAGIHKRIAETIEATSSGNPESHLSELAHHYYHAVPAASPRRVVDVLVRASERSRRIYANDDAILQLTRAAELVRRNDLRECSSPVLISLAELYELGGDYGRALGYYKEAAQTGADLRLWVGMAAVQRKQGDYEGALETLEEAIGTNPKDELACASLRLEQGWTLSVAGRFHEAIAGLREGLENVGNANSAVGAQLLLQLAHAEMELGHLEDALNHALAGNQILDAIEESAVNAQGYRVLGEAYERLGRLDEAARTLRQGVDFATRVGHVEERAGCLVNLGAVESKRGDVRAAVECHVQAAEAFERIGHASGIAICYGNLAELLFDADRLEEARRYCERAIQHAKAVGHVPTVADVLHTLARICLRLGQEASARTYAAAAAQLFDQMGASAQAESCRELLGRGPERQRSLSL